MHPSGGHCVSELVASTQISTSKCRRKGVEGVRERRGKMRVQMPVGGHFLCALLLLACFQTTLCVKRSLTFQLHAKHADHMDVISRRRLLRNSTLPLHGAVKEYGSVFLPIGVPLGSLLLKRGLFPRQTNCPFSSQTCFLVPLMTAGIFTPVCIWAPPPRSLQ